MHSETHIRVYIKDVLYTTAADSESSVTIEERTPMRVTLLAEGSLNGKGSDRYNYQVRIHAYNGLPLLKVVPTIMKKYGHPRVTNHKIEDFSLGFKLKDSPAYSYALGGEDAPATGRVSGEETAQILVKDADEWMFGGKAQGSGNPMKTKPLALGWGGLTGSSGGLSIGIHRFWENCPKSIAASGKGELTVGLYPDLMGKGQTFFTGMARTHHLLLCFHSSSRQAEEIQNIFAGFQRPLFAAAPPEWYCQKTRAFGHSLLYRETGEEKYLKTAVNLVLRGKPNHLSKDMGHMYRPVPYATGMLYR